MIPYLPQDTNELEIPVFYRHIVENLTLRSSHHESWHTHKRDTSVCWICDLVEVSNILITELERFISKSALDIDDSFLVQELNSEGEGSSLNYNEELDELHGYLKSCDRIDKARSKKSSKVHRKGKEVLDK